MNTENPKEPLYYPCMIDRTGHVRQKLTAAPMSRTQAEDFLKLHCPRLWQRGEAIPQPENHHYFK